MMTSILILNNTYYTSGHIFLVHFDSLPEFGVQGDSLEPFANRCTLA